MTPGSTRSLQMDRKKTREECVGTFNLISTDTELESKVCQDVLCRLIWVACFLLLIFIGLPSYIQTINVLVYIFAKQFALFCQENSDRIHNILVFVWL